MNIYNNKCIMTNCYTNDCNCRPVTHPNLLNNHFMNQCTSCGGSGTLLGDVTHYGLGDMGGCPYSYCAHSKYNLQGRFENDVRTYERLHSVEPLLRDPHIYKSWWSSLQPNYETREKHRALRYTLENEILLELKKHQKILEKKVLWVITQITGRQLLI